MRSTRVPAVLCVVVIAVVSLTAAGATDTPEEVALARQKAYLAQLDGEKPEKTLISTLVRVEEEFPDSSLAAARVAPLLHDQRSKVRRKAIRVLGVLQPELEPAMLEDAKRMLASADKDEVADTVRGLRWITTPSVVGLVVPLLAHPDEDVKREACRTLGILGDASAVSSIEPLLRDPSGAVREEADGAIAQLKAKPAMPPGGAAPVAAVAAATGVRGAVALKVVDNRPPEMGGREPRRVGNRRSAVGLKGAVKEKDPQAVPDLVGAALRDALTASGVEVRTDAPVTLVAQVLSYWMDWTGYDYFAGLAYKGTVAVGLTLQDAAGHPVWYGLCVAENHFGSDSKDKVFGPALARLTGRTRRSFESAAFRGALR